PPAASGEKALSAGAKTPRQRRPDGERSEPLDVPPGASGEKALSAGAKTPRQRRPDCERSEPLDVARARAVRAAIRAAPEAGAEAAEALADLRPLLGRQDLEGARDGVGDVAGGLALLVGELPRDVVEAHLVERLGQRGADGGVSGLEAAGAGPRPAPPAGRPPPPLPFSPARVRAVG